jgi:hypothetical protein
MIRRPLWLAAALALAAPATASPITVTFTAEVSSANPDRYPTFDFDGDPPTISGSITYEGEVSGSGSVTGPPYAAEFILGPDTVTGSTVFWEVEPSGCLLIGGSCASLGITLPAVGGDETLLLIFALPLASSDFPDPDALSDAITAAFLHLGPTQPLLIAPTLTSLSFVVPEPGGALLLAAGACAWLDARRRRKGS